MTQKDSSFPYSNLYIYMLEGVVQDGGGASFGDAYIGTWVEGDSSFLFFERPSMEVIGNLLRGRPELRLLDDFYFTYEQWQGGRPAPFRVGNLCVVPPWDRVTAEDKDIEILLDPGVVFGTGLHPTTRDCLRAVITLHALDRWEKVIDVGTGTGILSIAAARLGAKQVLAIDLNPLAVRTARKNVALNHLDHVIEVREGSAGEIAQYDADLIFANIHYEVIKDLLSQKAFLQKRWFILSGLMRSQARELLASIDPYGLTPLKQWEDENTWFTLLLENKCLG